MQLLLLTATLSAISHSRFLAFRHFARSTIDNTEFVSPWGPVLFIKVLFGNVSFMC